MPISIDLKTIAFKAKTIYIAESADFPLLGQGDSEKEAVARLLREIANYIDANPDAISTVVDISVKQ